jgi:hypothetical protein
MVIEKKRKLKTHKYITRDKNSKNKNYIYESDNSDSDEDDEWLPNKDSSSDEVSDDSDNYTECSSDDEIVNKYKSKNKKQKFNNEKFTELLSELYPSKYMTNKI